MKFYLLKIAYTFLSVLPLSNLSIKSHKLPSVKLVVTNEKLDEYPTLKSRIICGDQEISLTNYRYHAGFEGLLNNHESCDVSNLEIYSEPTDSEICKAIPLSQKRREKLKSYFLEGAPAKFSQYWEEKKRNIFHCHHFAGFLEGGDLNQNSNIQLNDYNFGLNYIETIEIRDLNKLNPEDFIVLSNEKTYFHAAMYLGKIGGEHLFISKLDDTGVVICNDAQLYDIYPETVKISKWNKINWIQWK